MGKVDWPLIGALLANWLIIAVGVALIVAGIGAY